MNIDKIAIDVVLLLPPEIEDFCRKINQFSNRENYPSFLDGYNPHITLGMGSVLVDDLPNFESEIKTICNELKDFTVRLNSLKTGKYLYFEVEVSEQLKNLHKKVFDVISKNTAGEVAFENFFEMFEYSTVVDWVNNFAKNSAYENYSAHITLGKDVEGCDTDLEFPVSFKPKEIGIFHLGIHGTCKQKIKSFIL